MKIVFVLLIIVAVLIAGVNIFYIIRSRIFLNSNASVTKAVEEIKTKDRVINCSENYDDNIVFKENVICENGIEYERIVVDEEPEMPEPEMLTAASGDTYSYIGNISIEKINLNMNIISKTTEELMNKSACKLWGTDPNRVGNLCIIGHNWRNTKLFSKVPTLEIGDLINITDLSGRTIKYEIYDKYTVNPEDTECLSQETDGRREITLITCTNDSKQRYVMPAKEV